MGRASFLARETAQDATKQQKHAHRMYTMYHVPEQKTKVYTLNQYFGDVQIYNADCNKSCVFYTNQLIDRRPSDLKIEAACQAGKCKGVRACRYVFGL